MLAVSVRRLKMKLLGSCSEERIDQVWVSPCGVTWPGGEEESCYQHRRDIRAGLNPDRNICSYQLFIEQVQQLDESETNQKNSKGKNHEP